MLFRSIVGSKIDKKDLERMFVEGFATLDEAVAAAIERYGKEASFLVIPHASDIIPLIGGELNNEQTVTPT